jgi:hypothetical protein
MALDYLRKLQTPAVSKGNKTKTFWGASEFVFATYGYWYDKINNKYISGQAVCFAMFV